MNKEAVFSVADFPHKFERLMHIVSYDHFSTIGLAHGNPEGVCRPRHHDLRRCPQSLRRKRSRYRVIASTDSSNAELALIRRQTVKRRERTTRLKGSCALQKLEFRKHSGTITEGRFYRCTAHNRGTQRYVTQSITQAANLINMGSRFSH
jgi:hypothetical protein